MFIRYAGRACLAMLSCVVAGTVLARAQNTTFDVPGASETYGLAINGSQVIAGYYTVGETYHSFVRAPDSTITPFDPAGATQSYATAINGRGAIAGVFEDGNNVEHGYLRSSKGRIAQIDAPGSSCTAVMAISGGSIAGFYCGDGGGAFLRTADGVFTTFGVPDALDTEALCINADGVTAGEWVDPDEGFTHAFLRAVDGTLTTFDAPGAESTTVAGINNAGAIAGSFLDSNSEHGYIRAADGTFTEFDPPQSTNTVVTAIDENGGIAGYYYNDFCATKGTACAFSRSPDGTIRTFTVKNHYTVASGVAHVQDGGTAITGFWVEYGGLHGFVRTR